MKKRLIIVTIDTLFEIIKDYCSGEIPQDAKPVRLMFKPGEAGKLAIVAESPSWSPSDTADIDIRFHLTRSFLVGSPKKSTDG